MKKFASMMLGLGLILGTTTMFAQTETTKTHKTKMHKTHKAKTHKAKKAKKTTA
jgi:hypothetical protein